MQEELGLQDWEPIDTAPQDGREVLLWQPGHQVYIGAKHPGRWWTDVAWANGFNYQGLPDCRPTHWMHLPAPPKPAHFAVASATDFHTDSLIDGKKR